MLMIERSKGRSKETLTTEDSKSRHTTQVSGIRNSRSILWSRAFCTDLVKELSTGTDRARGDKKKILGMDSRFPRAGSGITRH